MLQASLLCVCMCVCVGGGGGGGGLSVEPRLPFSSL